MSDNLSWDKRRERAANLVEEAADIFGELQPEGMARATYLQNAAIIDLLAALLDVEAGKAGGGAVVDYLRQNALRVTNAR